MTEWDEESIEETLASLYDKGLILMGVNEQGEDVYWLTPLGAAAVEEILAEDEADE